MEVDQWLDTVARIECVEFVDLSREIAVQSVRLPGDFHSDPADRIITALARNRSIPLITADTKIRSYPHVKTIW